MPFIPHTKTDIAEMLQAIGVDKIEDLFSEIPKSLRHRALDDIGPGISEMALLKLMAARAKEDGGGGLLCFIGAGAYQHHIPAAVWDITTRGEFMTCYTPYQAEASQGTLQLLYEFQTMMANLMAMEVSNASLYDGASALAEAILMAVRLTHVNKKKALKQPVIFVPQSIHPHYRATAKTITEHQGIELIDIPYHKDNGRVNMEVLNETFNQHADRVVALAIPQPNFFGILEDVDELNAWSQQKQILSIAVVNPMACALLKPPGQWGAQGVDIACGEGQPLGIPLASGGPYFGFLCCKKHHVRQMPGRVVGRTIDKNGKQGFVLTLQAREQHIRRAKATSNICTNQGLLVTAATIYMSLLGPDGLRQTALLCHERTRELNEELTKIPGVTREFHAPFFHEIVLRMPKPIEYILHELSKRQIQGGFALTEKGLENCLLICATETKSAEDIQTFAANLRDIVGEKLVCHA